MQPLQLQVGNVIIWITPYIRFYFSDDGVSTAVSETYFSEMTLSIVVIITILATSAFTAIVITVFIGLCYLR